LSPILDEPLNDLPYEILCDNFPCSKSKNFIETKSNCNKLQGFNLNLG
jgi:hypothetical protein